jgi:sortase A
MRFFRSVLGVVGELMITAGLILLFFVGWQLWWTDVAANKEQEGIASELEEKWKIVPPVKPSKATPKPQKLAQIPLGDAFALIRIPRLGRDYVRPVLEGVTVDILKQGVGHYPDTVGPGEVGNFGIAGHRITYGSPFAQLPDLRDGDAVVVETATQWYVYRMERSQIVSPNDVSVVAPVPDRPGVKPTEKLLTLTTCHPHYSSKQRYIVHTKLDEVIPKVPGVIPEVLS